MTSPTRRPLRNRGRSGPATRVVLEEALYATASCVDSRPAGLPVPRAGQERALLARPPPPMTLPAHHAEPSAARAGELEPSSAARTRPEWPLVRRARGARSVDLGADLGRRSGVLFAGLWCATRTARGGAITVARRALRARHGQPPGRSWQGRRSTAALSAAAARASASPELSARRSSASARGSTTSARTTVGSAGVSMTPPVVGGPSGVGESSASAGSSKFPRPPGAGVRRGPSSARRSGASARCLPRARRACLRQASARRPRRVRSVTSFCSTSASALAFCSRSSGSSRGSIRSSGIRIGGEGGRLVTARDHSAGVRRRRWSRARRDRAQASRRAAARAHLAARSASAPRARSAIRADRGRLQLAIAGPEDGRALSSRYPI